MFSPVDQIKERLNIVDVVSTYVALAPAGKNYKGKSPFKQERTPSFYVSPDKGLYHCFSTGKGGDMFTFIQEMEGLDFKGALKVLADKAGVSLKNWNPKEKEEKDRLYEAMEEATKIFEDFLSRSTEVKDYIRNRGIEENTIKEFRIGYVPDGWRNLYDTLKSKFSDTELSLVGLIKKTEKGVYDTFRDRIMFPICDSSGRVIAFSGRIFKDDGKSGKYVNSPDTPLFNKSDVLFAIDKAKNYIRKYNFTTIVEGQFDVISLHQAGFRNTVAVSGTAQAESTIGKDKQVNNLGIIKRLSNNVVLAFDADSAGVSAAKRSAHIGMSLGMDVKIVDIVGGKDPADFLKDFGKDAWSKILKEAQHIILFYVKKIKERAKDERD
ncbi:MAG: DNA primase, partial [Polynucleobacter sp.]